MGLVPFGNPSRWAPYPAVGPVIFVDPDGQPYEFFVPFLSGESPAEPAQYDAPVIYFESSGPGCWLRGLSTEFFDAAPGFPAQQISQRHAICVVHPAGDLSHGRIGGSQQVDRLRSPRFKGQKRGGVGVPGNTAVRRAGIARGYRNMCNNYAN